MTTNAAHNTFSPRLVGGIRPDYHDLDSIIHSGPLAGKSGGDLVMAIYDFFTSTLDGTYHFWSPCEVEGSPRNRMNVFDPVKLYNAYGWAICGQQAHMLHGLYTAGGLKARLIGIPGHNLCEVFYDDRWHVLDVDMWTWFRNEQGHVASAYDLVTNSQATILDNTDKSDPCCLPDRPLDDYARGWSKCPTCGEGVRDILPDWSIAAHEMDFQLRPGETLIRSQENQGRFHMSENWKLFMQQFGKEWQYGCPHERYEPFRTFGNGKWVYQPDLTSASEDWPLGLWESSDLAQDERGLLGPGSGTVRIASPYPFCGRPDWQGEKITHSDGVWLELAGEGDTQVEITDPEGQWRQVFGSANPFEQRVDITGYLSARYECLIRVTLGEGASLTRLRFEGFVMTAPGSLPRLVEGENRLQLRTGDRFGLCTLPWSEVVDFREGADMPAAWHWAHNARIEPYVSSWRQIVPEGEGLVSVAWKFDAPAEGKFAWAYVQASIREAPENQPRPKAQLDYSTDGKQWKKLAEVEVPNTHLQWDGSIDGRKKFQRPTKSVWVRLTSPTAITEVEFHGHLASAAAEGDELNIVHRWKEQGQERQFAAPIGADEYVVACGPNPTGHTIEMSVASRPSTRGQ